MIDHYRVLGVPRDADPARIRAAYLRLARRHHPDRHVHESEAERRRHVEAMQAANRAWAVLGDPTRRADHDRELDPGRGPTPTAEGSRFRMPEGASWRPRADDTGWMDDFAAWRDEDERLPDDPEGRPRTVVIVGPLLIAAAVVCVFLGAALDSRTMLAVGFASVLLGVAFMIVLPFVELIRSRRRDRR